MPRGIKNNLGETVDGSKMEVIEDQTLEKPSVEFNTEARDEAFMNEMVTIILADTTDENAPPHIILSVNGVTQPLLRGVPTMVRRKFVEVLARCKESKYNQRTANPMEPDRIEMVQRTAFAYPFEVVEDKNPKGRAWLRAVMTEAA
jgi:hypothetical protein